MKLNSKEHFWAKVQKTGSCWNWVGARTPNGYGKLRLVGKYVVAHRVAYEWLKGKIPDGLQIDHLCRNRACVNPEHLEVVSGRVNKLRGVSFSAINAKKIHCPRGHTYSIDNVYLHNGKRKCNTCIHEQIEERKSITERIKVEWRSKRCAVCNRYNCPEHREYSHIENGETVLTRH